MPNVQSQNNNISVNVSGGYNSGTVKVINDMSQYYANKAKEWAISEDAVEGSNHSSKYYAEQAQTAYDNLEANIDTLTEESIEEITTVKDNAIEEINETKVNVIIGASDIPLAFGAWSETPMGDNWLKVDSDGKTVSKADYPKLWTLLTNILDGNMSSSDINVCTPEQYEEWQEAETEETAADIEYSLAHYYVVDVIAETIKLPKLVSKNRIIGCNEVPVIGEANTKGGCYIIYNTGRYEEYQFVLRLEKATKTVSGSTKNYHKVTQWNDSTTVLTPTSETTGGLTKLSVSITSTLTNALKDNKHSHIFVKCASLIDSEGDVDISNASAFMLYPAYCECFEDTDDYNCCFRIYDEQYPSEREINYNKLPDCIPTGETETYLMAELSGYVPAPDIEDYNGDYRLYIKVA